MFLHSRAYWALLSSLVLLCIIPVTFGAGFFQLPKLVLLGVGVTVSGISAFLNREQLITTLPRPAIYTLLAYLTWILLTNTIWSSAPDYTLLGWREWYGGFFMQALFVVILILATIQPKLNATDSIMKLRKFPPVWLSVYFALSFVLMIVAVLEILGFNPILGSSWFRWNGAGIEIPSAGQPVATVGNSGWFAGVWLLLTPLPFLLKIPSKIISILWHMIIAVGVSSVHSKVTIITYIAFQIMVIAYTLIKRKWKLHYMITSILCIIFSIITFPLIERSNEFLYSKGIVNRLSSAVLLTPGMSEGSYYARIANYKAALRLIAERPLHGWGNETFHELFFDKLTEDEYRRYIAPIVKLKNTQNVRHFGDMHMVTDIGEPNIIKSLTYFEVAKPHNFIIEELYSNGFIGFIIITVSLLIMFRGMLISRNLESGIILIAIGLYAVYLLLWFTTIAVTPLACVLLAFAVRSSGDLAQKTEMNPTFSKI